MRVLGIDYGSRRVGVALGDTDANIASPLAILEAFPRERLFEKIRHLIQSEKIQKMIVGVPHSFQQRETENQQMKEIREFIHELAGIGVEIIEEDEVLSSRLAATQMVQRGQKGKRDDLAAATILQSWLDRFGVA